MAKSLVVVEMRTERGRAKAYDVAFAPSRLVAAEVPSPVLLPTLFGRPPSNNQSSQLS